MVTAAHNQSHAFGDSHPLNLPCVRKLHHHFHRGRRGKWNRLRHRPVRYTGFSRQNRPVRHKGGKSHLRQQPSRFLLVLRQFRDSFHLRLFSRRIVFIKTGSRHTLRQKFEQNLNQFPRINRSSIRRESDLHADQYASVPGIHFTCSSLQYLLAAPADRNQPALS